MSQIDRQFRGIIDFQVEVGIEVARLIHALKSVRFLPSGGEGKWEAFHEPYGAWRIAGTKHSYNGISHQQPLGVRIDPVMQPDVARGYRKWVHKV
ncbi:hypothetical protein [Lysobacter capsici]|uniref:hypothetical protein n=1 Tax=Lysobacter capsici TaxID=435897 RepID=UPI0011DFD612|nr:hypothetical protein [Lysobacter capsici]